MAVYTVRYISTCPGSEHIIWRLLKDGVEVKRFGLGKTKILQGPFDFEEVMPALMHEAIKAAGATTAAQAKTAIEAKSWSM